MTQYFIGMYQRNGGPPPELDMDRVMRDLGAIRDELKASGSWVFTGGLRRRRHRHRGAGEGRRDAHHRRPVRRGQGVHRRVHRRHRARPRRRARVGPPDAGATTLPIEVRPFQRLTCPPAPPRSSGSSARSTAARSPSWSASSATSTSPRRRSRTRSRRQLSAGRRQGLPPSPAGWIITTARNRAIDRLRRESSRADRHAQAALLHAEREPRRGGPRARRPAPPDLHLLPPGARPRMPRWR